MIEKNETIYNYFNNVICYSWTWKKLTKNEKEKFMQLNFDCVKGTEKQRIEIFNALYHAFLSGIGYKPIGWREAGETTLF